MSQLSLSDQYRPYIDLLDRVAILAREDTQAYLRVRTHIAAIREWFADRTGWRVIFNRELARLLKFPALASAGHGFRWAQQPLDYELLAWILWFAESSGTDQFLLGQLVEEVEVRANELLGPGHIDWDTHAHRLSLNRALKGLEQSGIVLRMDGDTEAWLSDRQADSLYEFTPLARHTHVDLPGAAYTPPTVGPSHEILSDHSAPAPAESTAGVAHRRSPLAGCGPEGQALYRTLLLSPALYACASPQAFAILKDRERREQIARDLRGTLGWDLEVTASYACLLRPAASEATEQGLFPFRSALSQVILLFCGALQELVQQGELVPGTYDRLRVSVARVSTILTRLRREHGPNWGYTLRGLGVQALTRRVLDTMQEWDLLAGPDADGQLLILPLVARFRGCYAPPESETGRLSQ